MTIHETYIWVRGVINSCQTPFQLRCADLVVENFKREFGDKDGYKKVLIDLLNDQYQTVNNPKPS